MRLKNSWKIICCLSLSLDTMSGSEATIHLFSVEIPTVVKNAGGKMVFLGELSFFFYVLHST
jgi:hypothetical protein